MPTKKTGKSHTSELTEHLKTSEQKEANSPKRARQQEIVKLRAEVNKIETKKTIQRINETKSWFLVLREKSTKQTNLYSN